MPLSHIVAKLLHFTYTDLARIMYQEVPTYGQEMPLSHIVAQLFHVTLTDHSP